MPTTKTPPNAVRTTNRAYTFFLEKLTFRGTSYYMTKAEMYQVFKYHFLRAGSSGRSWPSSDGRATVYTSANDKTAYAVETNGDTRNDFFSIGCMKFSYNATIKIAKWAGLMESQIKNYIVR